MEVRRLAQRALVSVTSPERPDVGLTARRDVVSHQLDTRPATRWRNSSATCFRVFTSTLAVFCTAYTTAPFAPSIKDQLHRPATPNRTNPAKRARTDLRQSSRTNCSTLAATERSALVCPWRPTICRPT